MNLNSIDLEASVRQSVREHGLMPCRIVRDSTNMLVVLEGEEPKALQVHLAASDLERITGLNATIRPWTSLSPAERSRLNEMCAVMV
jgi:hypothetical protein